ncbi:MAG: 5-(carboxyamino)imidazole ribonucleotide mutase [Lachnospirales bacterium]
MKVAIVMGSISDYEVLKGAELILDKFSIPYETSIVSAHRTPENMVEFAKNAKKVGYNVIIAGAGGAAHLPGMIAALTTLPVIGVPVKLSSLEGIDSLLSIVQMPKGVPVATVGINRSDNAGLLATKILAIANCDIDKKLVDFMEEQKDNVAKMNDDLITTKRGN